MLAALHPLGAVLSALFFAAVATGAEAISRQTGVPVFLAGVIQGVSVVGMLTASLFTGYPLRRPKTA
jgi:simple sugar transport system permease protein